jgi:hypothetical protein
MDTKEKAAIWKEYFTELLNADTPNNITRRETNYGAEPNDVCSFRSQYKIKTRRFSLTHLIQFSLGQSYKGDTIRNSGDNDRTTAYTSTWFADDLNILENSLENTESSASARMSNQ